MKFICHIIAILSIVFFLVGNCVYSYDTINGIYEYKEVTETFALKSGHINYLTIEDEKGNIQTIETTDVHPFWVVTDNPDLERAARSVVDENGVILYHENLGGVGGFWVEAKDLRVGDVFLGSDGKLSTLIGVTRVEQSGGIAVFNFTVEGNSNYFVLEKDYEYGQTCVLVHNGACGIPTHGGSVHNGSCSMPQVVQTGGHTLTPNAAKKIIKANNLNIHPKALGSILEKVKKAEKIASNHHGKICINGAYLDGKGKFLFNFLD